MPLPLNPRHGNAACTSPCSDQACPALSGKQRLQEGSKRERRGRSEGWWAQARAGGKERLGDSWSCTVTRAGRKNTVCNPCRRWESLPLCSLGQAERGGGTTGGSQSCSPGRGCKPPGRHCCCYTQHQTPALLKRSPARAAAAKQAKDPSQASSTCLCCLSGVFCTLRCSKAGEQQDTGQALTAISAKHWERELGSRSYPQLPEGCSIQGIRSTASSGGAAPISAL